MTTAELLQECHNRLRDTDEQAYLWSQSELCNYANSARDRLFLIVRKLIIDSTTANDSATTPLPLCSISLVAGTATYALSKKILAITRLKLASQTYPLPPSTVEELDGGYGDWQALADGDPRTYCIDMASDSITFVPPPLANDTAALTVYRMPLVKLALTAMSADLGFREEYHEDLIPWMLHLAYRKQDAETYNPGLAEEYRQTFLDRAADIKMELHRHHTKPHGNRMRRAFGAR